ncbi:MAG: MFS transporter [Dehalococcoidia bacterium]
MARDATVGGAGDAAGTSRGAPASTGAADAPERESIRLMIGLSAGHGVKHLCQGALLILMPSIRSALGLSDVAVGGIFTAQQISSGTANAPAGILTDMFRRRVALMLVVSMLCVTTAYLFIGLTQWYWLLLLAVVVLGTGTSLWHAPAFATLAARYPERRGLAMSAHLTGAQVGDTTAPLVIGLVLGGFAIWGLSWAGLEWRMVALLLVIPAAGTGALVLALFKSGGNGVAAKVSLTDYLSATRRLFKNPGVLSMVALHATRGAAHQSFQIFLVIYMSDVLRYSPLMIGVHISLLTLAGIISTPLMGALSDRIGRKPVIIGMMSTLAAIIFTFTIFESGWPMAIALAFLGMVLFSVMPIITAAAMDVTDKGSEGTSIALMFAGGAVIGAFAPVAAGAINSRWDFQGVVIFAGSIATIGALIAMIAPTVRRRA